MRYRLAALILGAALAVAGCNSGGETAAGNNTAAGGNASGDGKALRIAFIPKGATHEFWKMMKEGADRAASEMGVEVIWKGPIKEDDRESQIKTVEDFINQKVDGIVLAPLDDTALRVPVTEAKGAGIPTLIVDSDIKDAEYVSFVATDNRKGGEMAGERLATLLGGKGKVVMLRYQEGSASTMNREAGFMDAMKKYPDIQVVSENQYAGPTTETAAKAAENLLAAYKNPDGTLSVDGIYTPNESSTFGMLRVLQDNKWAGKVKFVGFDSSPKLVEALQSDEIHGLILQNPRNMGYLGVKTMVEHLRGSTPEKRIDTGATLVTKENMTESAVAELLKPPVG